VLRAGSRLPLGGVLLFAGWLLASACGGGDPPAEFDHEVEAVVREWSIEPEVDSVPAGTIRFSIANRGPARAHTFKVVRTELSHDALPVVGDRPEETRVDETKVEVVFGLSEFFRGRSGIATLEAGSYALICNLPGHYERGMSAPFVVE
jgi:hypothetical protein